MYRITDLENIEKLVFFFKYPKFSNFLRIVFVLFILYFDPVYLISYIVGIFIIVFLFQNENWYPYTMPLLNKLFFN